MSIIVIISTLNLVLNVLIISAATWNITKYLVKQRIYKPLIVLLYFFMMANQTAWVVRMIIRLTHEDGIYNICSRES